MICKIKGAAPELRLALQLSPSPREGDFMPKLPKIPNSRGSVYAVGVCAVQGMRGVCGGVRGCVCVVPNGSQRFQQIKVKRKLSI